MPPMLPQHKDSTLCDCCPNTKLVQRADDTKAVIIKRQRIYQQEVGEVLQYYQKKGVLTQFEPKKGVSDYPQMLQAILEFVN